MPGRGPAKGAALAVGPPAVDGGAVDAGAWCAAGAVPPTQQPASSATVLPMPASTDRVLRTRVPPAVAVSRGTGRGHDRAGPPVGRGPARRDARADYGGWSRAGLRRRTGPSPRATGSRVVGAPLREVRASGTQCRVGWGS